MGSRLEKLQEYLEELQHIKELGTSSAMVENFLDAELLLCEKKIKLFASEKNKQEVLGDILKLWELLKKTSEQMFGRQIQKQIVAIQEKVGQIYDESTEGGLSLFAVKERMIDCQVMLALVIYDLKNEDEDFVTRSNLIGTMTTKEPETAGTEPKAARAELQTRKCDPETAGTKLPANKSDRETAGTKLPANKSDRETAGTKLPANKSDRETAGTKLPANKSDRETAGTKLPAKKSDRETAGTKLPANKPDPVTAGTKLPANKSEPGTAGTKLPANKSDRETAKTELPANESESGTAGTELHGSESAPEIVEDEAPSSVSTLEASTPDTKQDAPPAGLPTSRVEIHDWNQTDKFVKLYLDVPGVNAAHVAGATLACEARHVSLVVPDVDGRNYEYSLRDLSYAIKPNKSKIRLIDGRIVLFLKKEPGRISWRELTAATFPELSVQIAWSRMLEKYQDFHRMVTVYGLCPMNFMLEAMCMSGFHVISSGTSIDSILENMEIYPAEVVYLNLHSSSSTPFSAYEKAVRAFALHDCYVSLANVQYSYSSEVQNDDFLVSLLDEKPGKLATFSGSLSALKISNLPPVMIQLKLHVSCAQQLDAISTMPTNLGSLHVRIALNMDLRDVKPLRARKLALPLVLVFFGATNADLNWLIAAIDKLKRRRFLPGGNEVSTKRGLRLLACRLTADAHIRLARELPPDIVSVVVEDSSMDDSIPAAVAGRYRARGCKLRFSKFAELDDADAPIHQDWFDFD
ncbi:uncharacterized protein LOC108674581 [Hyalella azteca]|uniref:Uncharacterized protein LOC108674581 n=1 Tax=Hyalella azteca TaxID=294128 RepID=A0A8B7NW76_HYAAZ|nr:uncharacterized protein LOC108674581 [Hyalella azteca]